MSESQADFSRRFGGVSRLYGEHGAARLASTHAVVVGVGGVGSWAAEALARCALGRITLIDLDHIAESNTNRQLHALGEEYGKAKVLAMAERLRAIHPGCEVGTIEEFVDADNVEAVLPAADLVLDCIDQVNAKAALVACCRRRSTPVYVSGAGGGRLDPTRIAVGDLARIQGDPLLAKLRHKLRRDFGFPREGSGGRIPKFGVSAVYSDEPVRRPAAACSADSGFVAGLACAGYGSSVVVTASLGFALAAAAINDRVSSR